MALVSAGVAFVVASFLTYMFMRPGSSMHILDHPNERSLHTRPTPRTGGVAIVIGIGAGSMLFATLSGVANMNAAGWLGSLATLIALLSYFDDRWHLPVVTRLMTHVAVSALLIVSGFALDSFSVANFATVLPTWAAAVLTVLFAVWMINLYNFMDGMDGFAGGMTFIGFGTLAVLGWWSDDPAFAAFNLIIAAAAVGFLIFNFPPARIFMGDTGSSTLGFLVAGMSLWGNTSGIVPIWISVLIFFPFVVDATVTLIRRTMNGEKIWKAHRSHYYQRLVQTGWGHRKTVLVEYVLMTVCAGGALLAQSASAPAQWGIIAVVGILYTAFFRFVRALEMRTGINA